MKLWCVLACVAFIAKIDTARILAYIPSPSISHQLPFRPLFQELARRGHELVVITTDPAFPKDKAPANLKEIDIHDISYSSLIKALQDIPKGKKTGFIDEMETLLETFTNLIDQQLQIKEVRNAIHGNKYDLLLLEAFSRPALALSHLHKVPVIMLSSFGSFFQFLDAMGAPTHPLLYPSSLSQKIYNLTYLEKIEEFYNRYRQSSIMNKKEEYENNMLKKHFGDDVPSSSELYNNIDMLFLNIHPIFEGNRPVPPSVIYMWGIHKKIQKELPKDLKHLLDTSIHGVIYMSFGTNTDPTTLPSGTIDKFVKVFCQLPYDVLFKWNNNELPGRCDNIKIGKWFPQSDLLRHPNVKLFVTQGGLQSTDEALTAGVPLVGIPTMGDQWYNVEKYVHFKIGVQLDLETLTEESFKEAVTTVINDESYRHNIKKLDGLMRDEPMPALDRAVWWVEHVLRHGGARHLRAPAANISWTQYLELELVFTVVLFVIATLSLAVVLVCFLCNCLKRKFATNVKLKRK